MLLSRTGLQQPSKGGGGGGGGGGGDVLSLLEVPFQIKSGKIYLTVIPKMI